MKFKQERQELVDGVIETEERYYIGGAEFVDGVMQTFYFPDGRIVLDVESKEIFAQYKIKDHLGNTAVVFQDKDLDDVVIDEEAADAFGLELEVLQRDFYYPFGLSMEGAWIVGSTDDPRMDYRYNGKELSQVTGLLAYGFRYYDPVIGRFGGVDPKAEKYTEWSPYNYVLGNPIGNTDPRGDTVRVYTETVEATQNIGRHAFIRVTTDEYDKIIELWGPGQSGVVGGTGMPRFDEVTNDSQIYGRNNVKEHAVTRPDNSPEGDLQFEETIIELGEFFAENYNVCSEGRGDQKFFSNVPEYNALGPNSNGFVNAIIQMSGGSVDLPARAVAKNNTQPYEEAAFNRYIIQPIEILNLQVRSLTDQLDNN